MRAFVKIAVVVLAGGAMVATCAAGSDAVQAYHKYVADGSIRYRVTTPEELEVLLGKADRTETGREGGFDKLLWVKGGMTVHFGKMRNFQDEYTIYGAVIDGEAFLLESDKPVVLRSVEEIRRLDSFYGLCNVSLAELDLREARALIEKLPFDSTTVWPPADKLPAGYNPPKMLDDGKNPGLGVRSLHGEGIDGKGITIAILDGPIFKDHIEYADRLEVVESIDVDGAEPEMHGAAVASIAVGKTCGTAPGAKVRYYEIPMWKWNQCKPYADVVKKIIISNKSAAGSDKVRAISISMGRFPEWGDYDLWGKTVARAERNGILVVTCDTQAFMYGMMDQVGDDPDDAKGYRRGRYFPAAGALGIPKGTCTRASHRGKDVYAYDKEGGMSWGAPYLAGLAALAFQVNGEVTPAQIRQLWVDTATKREPDPVINPVGFIEEVKKLKKQ